MSSTRVTRLIEAPPERVYAALIDARAIEHWRFPDDMGITVHMFEARQGGRIRVSLTYRAPGQMGKTAPQTDAYHGHFKELVPNLRVVEAIEFETSDPAMRGVMTCTVALQAEGGATLVSAFHDGLPPGISTADNEAGWRMALEKLARLVQAA